MTISEIIKRLEAGETGRAINIAIAGWVGTLVKTGWAVPNFPEYTTSLDAALTLVPEGSYAKLQIGREGSGWAWVEMAENEAVGYAKSPALALCLAALRAREAQS